MGLLDTSSIDKKNSVNFFPYIYLLLFKVQWTFLPKKVQWTSNISTLSHIDLINSSNHNFFPMDKIWIRNLIEEKRIRIISIHIYCRKCKSWGSSLELVTFLYPDHQTDERICLTFVIQFIHEINGFRRKVGFFVLIMTWPST